MKNLYLKPSDYDKYIVKRDVKKWYDLHEEGDVDGVQYVFKFDNSYGASVIKHAGSYGYEQDLWELAVLWFDGLGNYGLTYSTPITTDVEGYLTDEEVFELLGQINILKP